VISASLKQPAVVDALLSIRSRVDAEVLKQILYMIRATLADVTSDAANRQCFQLPRGVVVTVLRLE
jgi:hypothetical protein